MIRTNYWIGYRLAFETEERVRFVVFQEPGQVRLPDYEEQGRNSPVIIDPLRAGSSSSGACSRGTLGFGLQL